MGPVAPGADRRSTQRYTAATVRAHHRGGGLYTRTLSQWIGSQFAAPAARAGWHPASLTLGSLLLGVASGAVVAATADHGVLAVIGAVFGLVGWQLAYGLDCADGQLARATGKASAAGGRLDVLVDIAVQIAVVVAICTVTQRASGTGPVLLATFAGSWLINLLTSVLGSSGSDDSLVSSTNAPVQVIKLIRDYGALILLVGVIAAFYPPAMLWFVVVLTAVNLLFLLLSILSAFRTSRQTTGR